MREMLRRVLGSRDFEVVLAENGVRAHQLASEQAFDLALCDVAMPGIDGIATLAGLKALRPSTEVVMMSGYAPAAAVTESRRLGAYAFVEKPFDIDRLFSTLERALEHQRQRNPLPAP